MHMIIILVFVILSVVELLNCYTVCDPCDFNVSYTNKSYSLIEPIRYRYQVNDSVRLSNFLFLPIGTVVFILYTVDSSCQGISSKHRCNNCSSYISCCQRNEGSFVLAGSTDYKLQALQFYSSYY